MIFEPPTDRLVGSNEDWLVAQAYPPLLLQPLISLALSSTVSSSKKSLVEQL
jgi:hypothetical protein